MTFDRPHIPLNSDRARGLRITSIFLGLGWIAGLLALTLFVTGGFAFHLGHLAVRAHSPWPAAIVAVASAAAAWRRGGSEISDALGWWWTLLERRAAPLAVGIAIVAGGVGIAWGTYVAGGPDSYCYLNQAEMLASGQLRQQQPIVREVPWPQAAITFTPIGHLPAADDDAAIVPACPAGYPVLMAASRAIAGRSAMFLVVPILGGLTVWWTFVLGRQLGGAATAVVAALLLASSPTFLYQIVQPMTDVPATALWTVVLVTVLRTPARQPGFVSGLLTGAALLIRPNLVPLAAVIGCASLLARPVTLRTTARALTAFAAGVLPLVLVILWLNVVMHGGPAESGYGKLQDLFTLAHVRGNLVRYPVWLVETQTPFILLALAAPWIARESTQRRDAWWLLLFALATFACYIPYTVWDAWWFLRFVLPAFPPLLVLSTLVGMTFLQRLPAAWRTAALTAVLTALVGFQVITAANRAAFELRDLEARFRDAGEYVARRLPSNAMVFAVTESGSVRFYSGRLTIFWSALDPAWLDRAVAFLSAHGFEPYFLFESEEEPLFRERFANRSPLGNLDWPPLAEINQQVRIYKPADRDLYLRGGRIDTDVVWTKR